MTRRFSRILAALALLTFLAVPLGMRGQNTTVTKTMNQIVADNNYTVSSGTTIGDIVTTYMDVYDSDILSISHKI